MYSTPLGSGGSVGTQLSGSSAKRDAKRYSTRERTMSDETMLGRCDVSDVFFLAVQHRLYRYLAVKVTKSRATMAAGRPMAT